MREEPLLAAEHVSMHFFNQDGVLEVLDDISFSLKQGKLRHCWGLPAVEKAPY